MRVERLRGGAAVAELEKSLRVLSLKERELEKERDKLIEFFCPGAKNLESAQQQQKEEDSYPAMSAMEQIIYGKMEVKRAEMEVLALAEWGSSHKKVNSNLRRQERKRSFFLSKNIIYTIKFIQSIEYTSFNTIFFALWCLIVILCTICFFSLNVTRCTDCFFSLSVQRCNGCEMM